MNIIAKQKILLPHNVDMQKWAVVACDQFTAQPKYWKKLEKFVGNAPSALKLILPEIYLSDNMDKRIEEINQNMADYLDKGLFKEINGFILVEREVENKRKRVGLVMSVDLEAYEWKRIKCPIRATEDTIVERLPARVNIRKGALIELPHILLLIDDEERNIIEPIYQSKDKLKKLYDFELNMGGGRITGYEVKIEKELLDKFNSLVDKERQIKKYGWDAKLMFTVGDGNHSLASAKAWWEELKKELSEEERQNHPARYALVEVVNIYDEALLFEPIHRVMLECDISFIEKLKENLKGNGKLRLFTADKEFVIAAPEKASEQITKVQQFIESYIKSYPSQVDYIHGENHLREVVKDNKNSIGILMPTFEKSELFDYVLNVGNLPKKAFSIGGPEFKKYYLEAKKIK
ncbi:MAG: DUF1015 domain-containing protein [Bacillota bacterium]|nr:DUF1015 domain-containing protein [Bacillota bacterium]HHU43534.1 DUF1015 domain-containing protein [Clostridiales bacterium]